MKNLILITLLFCNTTFAELMVKRQGEGYMFSFVEGDKAYCWGMPDLVDLNYFDQSWRTVPETAIQYNWPKMTDPASIESCNSLKIPVTQAGPFYTISHTMRVTTIGTVPAGIPCGDPIITFKFLRSVTYNGQTGFASCN
jgi:hypothetical protein